jgi:hypothetical protein
VMGRQNAHVGRKGIFSAVLVAAFAVEEFIYTVVQVLLQHVGGLLVEVITFEEGIDRIDTGGHISVEV